MGKLDYLDFSRKDAGVRMCENVLIVASPRNVENIDWASDPAAFPGLVVIPCEGRDPIPPAALASCSLLLLEIDPGSRKSMERLAAIKEDQPDLPIIAAIPDASVSLVRTLVRAGVADVVSLPLQFDEVFETAVAVLGQQKQSTKQEARLAPMFAVARSIGGCGATSVATHLAAELAEIAPGSRGVAIVDLDLQFGSVADFMSGDGKGSIVDLLTAEERLDEDLMRSIARQVAGNVWVFAAPEAIPPLESVDTDRLLSVLAMIRRNYDYVILDLPANWTNWALSALSAADVVLLVAELSVGSLRQAKRRLELFDSVGIEKDRIAVVVNRVQRRLFRTIDVSDAAETLGREVLGSITLEDPLVGSAQDQGVLVQQLQRKSRFHADVRHLAELLNARCPTGAGQ